MTGFDNLVPWRKGQSGNPEGRPKGAKNRSTILRQFLDIKIADIPALSEAMPSLSLHPDVTVEEAISISLINQSVKGDIQAIKEIQDTLHGKIKDKSSVEHSFKQMGRVSIGNDPVTGAVKELSFSVGSDPTTTGEDEEDEE